LIARLDQFFSVAAANGDIQDCLTKCFIELGRFRKASKKGIAILLKHSAADVKPGNLKIKRVYRCSACHGTDHNRAGHDWIESHHRENDGPPVPELAKARLGF
jgi:hypothetical protein